MNNFENVKRVWNDLDSVHEKRFPQMSNTEFFRTLLGFDGSRSGIDNIRSRIMQDLDDSADSFKEFSNFMSALTMISDQLEAGASLNEEVTASQIFEYIQQEVLTKEAGEDAAAGSGEGYTIIDVQSGVLSVIQEGRVSAADLVSTGCVFSYTVIDADNDVVTMRAAEDSEGYLAFSSAKDRTQWVFSKIASQSVYDECTEFEKAVLINTLYAISAKRVEEKIAFLSDRYFEMLSGEKNEIEGEEKHLMNVSIDLGNVRVVKDEYVSVVYEYVDAFGDKNLVTVVK